MIDDLVLGMISLSKAPADPAGHYSRPDVTRLLLDNTPRERVVLRRRSAATVPESNEAEAETTESELVVGLARQD